MSRLWITPRAHADLLRARELARPREACGLLVGRASGERTLVLRAVRVPNRARDAKQFRLCPQGWMRVERAARRQALTILGPWHSHPDHGARPSPLDRLHGWPGRPNLIVGEDGIRGWVQAAGIEEPTSELRVELVRP